MKKKLEAAGNFGGLALSNSWEGLADLADLDIIDITRLHPIFVVDFGYFWAALTPLPTLQRDQCDQLSEAYFEAADQWSSGRPGTVKTRDGFSLYVGG